MCVCTFLLVYTPIKVEKKKKTKTKTDSTKKLLIAKRKLLEDMKLIRATFLLCQIAILLLLTPTSSHGLSTEEMVTKVSSRKLMIISSEHVNVMVSTTVHVGSNEKLPLTSLGKSENEFKKSEEEEEKNALSKYLSMDYPKFRRRRPVHNKSLPRTP